MSIPTLLDIVCHDSNYLFIWIVLVLITFHKTRWMERNYFKFKFGCAFDDGWLSTAGPRRIHSIIRCRKIYGDYLHTTLEEELKQEWAWEVSGQINVTQFEYHRRISLWWPRWLIYYYRIYDEFFNVLKMFWVLCVFTVMCLFLLS